jgi:hypothetical protein
MNLSPAKYALPTTSIDVLFPNLLDYFEQYIYSGAGTNDRRFSTLGYEAIMAGATTFKHHGFLEEREVRVVAMPGSQRMFELVHQMNKRFAVDKIKSQNLFHSSEKKRRYIALFEKVNAPLPIRRIIVGPSSNQNENYTKARRIIGPKIPIYRSATPFVG